MSKKGKGEKPLPNITEMWFAVKPEYKKPGSGGVKNKPARVIRKEKVVTPYKKGEGYKMVSYSHKGPRETIVPASVMNQLGSGEKRTYRKIIPLTKSGTQDRRYKTDNGEKNLARQPEQRIVERKFRKSLKNKLEVESHGGT